MPGGEVELAIVMHTASGWHGYWLNPGDAGLPMKIEWRLPRGQAWRRCVSRFRLRLLVAGIVNYVYKRPCDPDEAQGPYRRRRSPADPGEGAMACLHGQGLRPRAR